MATQKKKRGRRGQVGPQTYNQVCRMVAERKISLTKAFDEVILPGLPEQHPVRSHRSAQPAVVL